MQQGNRREQAPVVDASAALVCFWVLGTVIDRYLRCLVMQSSGGSSRLLRRLRMTESLTTDPYKKKDRHRRSFFLNMYDLNRTTVSITISTIRMARVSQVQVRLRATKPISSRMGKPKMIAQRF